MKDLLFRRLCFLPVLLMIAALLPACKKNTENDGKPPVITAVKSYVSSPNDTVLHSLVANGQYVVITGQNLANATHIEFDGVTANFNSSFVTSTNAVMKIPEILFSAVDTTKLYTIRYTTPGGSVTFPFKLGPAKPTVSAISNVFAAPGDSVYVYGQNLVLVQGFSYGGTAIASFKPAADGSSIGFLMPAATPGDQVVITAKAGKVIFKIVATPTITRVSNENPSAGDSVYVYGTYLKNIESLTFAGAAVSSFVSSADGSRVAFVSPTLTASGPVSVTTKFGTATTVYKVNDIATGALSNWEWSGMFNWQWWGGANLTSGDPGSGWPPYSADFPGNKSLFMTLKTGILAAGEGNTYSSYAILLNGAQWVPAANLSDPTDSWAFKFDVSIKQLWNGGSIQIQSSFGSYVALWEPWQKSAGTAAYKTNGWVTVTIPLSSFRAADATLGAGRGVSLTKITDLLGPSGNSGCTMYIHNYGAAATATTFYGAFDNLRVVKIK